MLEKRKMETCRHITMAKHDFNFRLLPLLIVFFIILAVAGNSLAMVQGPMRVLQLKKGARQITLKATGDGQQSIVNMCVMTQ